MTDLVIGVAIFLGVHSIAIIAPGFRESMRARIGEGAWKGLYSVASLAGFILICRGFPLARLEPVVLYTPAHWLHYIAVVVMLPVFPLLLASFLPGRIHTAVRQPMLAGVKFWCLAHLLANGLLADTLLFGSFLAWAVADRIALKHRPPQNLRTLPARPWNDAVAVIIGLAVYVFFISWAHQRLFGVAPLA
jgi:uncharacterized membrane protein